MNIPEEDNRINLFYQLKHLFFDDNLDDYQLTKLIREDPLHHIERMLLTVTREYSRKLDEIIQPYKQQNHNLTLKLKEQNEKLVQHMEDNQVFKCMIDQLQDQRKQLHKKLQQSLYEIESSKQSVLMQTDQNEKIKNEASKLFANYQQIYDQYLQQKQINSHKQTEINTLKATLQTLKMQNEKSLASNIEITNKLHLLTVELRKQKQKNTQLTDRITQKEEFIASFIEEYNNFHFFSRQQTQEQSFISQKYKQPQTDINELKQLSFTSYIDQEVISQKSSDQSYSLRKLSSNIQSPLKTPEPQLNMKFQSPDPFKKTRAKLRKPSAFLTNSIQLKQKHGECLQGTMSKVGSSRNLHEKNKSSNLRQSNLQEQKQMMQTFLKNKIAQKNQRIVNLQSQMRHLRIQFIEQRQNITVMEGDYELQIDELKNQLAFIKDKLSSIESSYLLSKVEAEAYRDKNKELQIQLQAIKEEHSAYRQELKMKCKAFMIDRMDQIQQYYQQITKKANSLTENKPQKNQSHEVLPLSHFGLQQKDQNSSVQLEEARDDMFSFSQLHSFGKLSSHYINGNFDLHLSTFKFQSNHEQAISQEMFQLQSDLGNFTERINLERQSRERERIPCNFTERSVRENQSAIRDQQVKYCKKTKRNMQINSNLYQIAILSEDRFLKINHQDNICILPSIPKNLKLSLYNNFAQKYEPILKITMLQINSLICSTMLAPLQKKFEVLKLPTVNLQPKLKPRNSIANMCSITLKVVKNRQHLLHSGLIQVTHRPKIKSKHLTKQRLQFICIQPENRRTSDYEVDEQKYLQTSHSTTSLIGNFMHRLSLIQNTVDITIDDEVSMFNKDMHLQWKQKCLSRSRASTVNAVCQVPNSKLYALPITPKAVISSNFSPELQQSQTVIQKISAWKEENFDEMLQIGFKESPICSKVDITQTHHQLYETTTKQAYRQISMFDTAITNKKAVFKDCSNFNLTESIDIDSDRATKPMKKVETIPYLNSSLNESPASLQNSYTLNKSQLKQDLSISICSEKPEFSFSCQNVTNQEEKAVQNQVVYMKDEMICSQIDMRLNMDQNVHLRRYLDNHNLRLKFQKSVEKSNFKKPNELDKKIIIFSARSKNELQTFLLNSCQIYCLQTAKSIKFEKSKYLNQNNFMFGQSEVMVTSNGHLVINRSGKKKKLSGNLQDGDWLIDSYIVCAYTTIN